MSKIEPSTGALVAPSHFAEARAELEAEFGESVTVDGLTGSWFIFQRARGHRHSVDDVLTAHYALQVSPRVTTHLDLGAGIGTVGLLVLWRMANETVLTALEAQTLSHRLLVANVVANGLTERVRPMLGDLRQFNSADRFPLITGSPPYFPVSAGIVPQDPQKAHARFELRGDVSDYARAAARALTADGWFVFCFPTPQKQRALDAVANAGLFVARVCDVIPRAGLAPLFSLFACRSAAVTTVIDEPFVVRTADGVLSATMSSVRRSFGF